MKIGILTGRGDCPALNAVIRAAVKTSIGYGWDVLGIEEGFNSLVQCKCRILTTASVSGIPLVGVPKTIDNDLNGTIVTFGFDTAVNTARDALDKLHTTAEIHRRVLVVEVMGRNTGWIALQSGIAGCADVILIPEIPYKPEKIAHSIMVRERMGKHFSIVVVAEGAFPVGGKPTRAGPRHAGREARLSGIGERVASTGTD